MRQLKIVVFIILIISALSIPFFSARAHDSAMLSIAAHIKKLPHSFTTLPAPGSSPK